MVAAKSVVIGCGFRNLLTLEQIGLGQTNIGSLYNEIIP